MSRLRNALLACVALLLGAQPASAAWTVGAITGGAFDSSTADDVLAAPSANTAIEDVILVHCAHSATGLATSGTSTLITVDDTAGNSYTRIVERSVDGGTNDYVTGLFYSITTVSITTGDTVRCLGPATADGKTIRFKEFNFGAGSTVSFAGQTNSGNTTAATYSTNSVTGLSAVERLWVGGALVIGASSTINCATSYACGAQLDSGDAGSDLQSLTGWLVQSVTGDDFDGTFGASESFATVMAAIDEVPAGGTPTECRNGPLLGVAGPCAE